MRNCVRVREAGSCEVRFEARRSHLWSGHNASGLRDSLTKLGNSRHGAVGIMELSI